MFIMSTLSYFPQCLRWWLWLLPLLSIALITKEINGLNLNRQLSESDPNWSQIHNFTHHVRNIRDVGEHHHTLQLDVTFRDLPSEKGFLIGSSPSVVMDVNLTNSGGTTVQPILYISWWRLELKGTTPQDICSPFAEEHNLVTYKCKIGKLLGSGESTSVAFEFDMSTLIVSDHTIYEAMFNVTAATESVASAGWGSSGMAQSDSDSKAIMLPLYAEADLHMEGNSLANQEILLEEISSSTVSFHQTFQIGLEGPSPVANVIAVFQLPAGLATENDAGAETRMGAALPIVNVRGLTKVGDRLVCHPTQGHFLTTSFDAISGSEHSPDYSIGDDDEDPDFEVTGMGGQDEDHPMDKYMSKMTSSNLVKNGSLVISCNSPFVTCIEVTCRMPEFRPDTVASVSFNMDMESDLIHRLMDTHQVNAIRIESSGKVTLPYLTTGIQPSENGNPDEAKALTVIGRHGKTNLSYILAGVIGAVVGLVLLIVAVYAYFHLRKLRRGKEVKQGDVAEMNPLNMSGIPTATQTDYRI